MAQSMLKRCSLTVAYNENLDRRGTGGRKWRLYRGGGKGQERGGSREQVGLMQIWAVMSECKDFHKVGTYVRSDLTTLSTLIRLR